MNKENEQRPLVTIGLHNDKYLTCKANMKFGFDYEVVSSMMIALLDYFSGQFPIDEEPKFKEDVLKSFEKILKLRNET